MKKKNMLNTFLREKRVKQKIIRMRSHPKFVSRLFLKKRKENELHRKYMLFGGPAENLSSYNFADITKVMILFHLQ